MAAAPAFASTSRSMPPDNTHTHGRPALRAESTSYTVSPITSAREGRPSFSNAVSKTSGSGLVVETSADDTATSTAPGPPSCASDFSTSSSFADEARAVRIPRSFSARNRAAAPGNGSAWSIRPLSVYSSPWNCRAFSTAPRSSGPRISAGSLSLPMPSLCRIVVASTFRPTRRNARCQASRCSTLLSINVPSISSRTASIMTLTPSRTRLPARSRTAPSRREGLGADMSGRDAQGLGLLLRVLAKEAHHFRRGVRPLWVGMRSARTPPRPGMAHLVDNPLLHEGTALRVTVDGAGVGIPIRHLPLSNRYVLIGPGRGDPLISGLDPWGEHLVGIHHVDGRIAIPMEHNRRDHPCRHVRGPRSMALRACGGQAAVPHGDERGG